MRGKKIEKKKNIDKNVFFYFIEKEKICFLGIKIHFFSFTFPLILNSLK